MKSSKLFILLVALALLAACGGESESPAEPTVVQAFMADPEAVAGSFEHRSWYVAPYVRFKARRVAGYQSGSPDSPRIVVP